MKVYDIIVEAPSNAAAYLQVLGKMVSVSEIDTMLGSLARLVKNTNFTAKEIADSWVASARKAGLSLEEIVVMGERELRAVGVENALIKKALKQVDAIEPGIFAKVTARIKSNGSAGWMGGGSETVMKYANLLGLAVPIGLCIKNIGLEYYDYLNSEQTEKDYAKFQNSAQYWINQCVGEVAVLITGNFLIARVVSIPGGWPGFTGAKKLQGMYLTLARTGQIAFTAAAMSPQGRQYMAEMFVADLLLGNMPVAVGGRIEYQPAQKVIRDMIGGWTTRALGWFNDLAQKVYDPAGAAKKTADTQARAAADKAKKDAAYQGFSKSTPRDAYGMPIQQADPRGKITPSN